MIVISVHTNYSQIRFSVCCQQNRT